MWNEPTKEELELLPGLYETESVPLEAKIIRMHFFIGNCDWYVVEWDRNGLFWGFACLNGDLDCAEWGYMSLQEMKELRIGPGYEIDRDLHWEPKPACEVDLICRAQGWPMPERKHPQEKEVPHEV